MAQLRRIGAIAPMETLQRPTLIDRGAEAELLPYCEEAGIGAIVYSPMASGLLTGAMTAERIAGLPDDDWRKHDARFTEPQLSRHLALVGRLARGGPARRRARWRSPGCCETAVDGAIVGLRRPGQASLITAAASLTLSDEEISEIAG